MMGMRTFPYWASWFFFFTIVNTVISLLAVIILDGLVGFRTQTFVIWLVYWMYGQSIFSFIMLMQSFFKDARTAAVVITIVYFGTAMSFNVGENAETWKKFMVSLSPTACMT